MEIEFRKAKSLGEIQNIYDYTIDAFSDTPDFEWELDAIKQEIDEGWELFGVYSGKEVIAAAFVKKEGTGLLTKNTAIKLVHQGSGNSHKLKSFFEAKARELKLQQIYHYCRIDNFRMYSLNESHGYKKTTRIRPKKTERGIRKENLTGTAKKDPARSGGPIHR